MIVLKVILVSALQASRIKQRKEIRRENKERVTGGNPVKRKHFEQDNDANEEDSGKKRKDEGIVSSLFRKNPEVPDIDITRLIWTL